MLPSPSCTIAQPSESCVVWSIFWGTKEPLSLNHTRPATHPPRGVFGVLTGWREKIGDMDFGMARGLLDKIIGMPSEIVARSLRS